MKSGAAETGLRERKKAQTREAILDAALALFERQGYDTTTVEEIAAEANVSPRTFFRYFDTKLDVVMEHADAEVEDVADLLLARPAEETPLEAVRSVITMHLIDELRSPDSRLAREMRLMLCTPSLRNQIQEHVARHQAELTPALAKRMGLADNAVAAHVVAGAVTNAVWSALERWVADGGTVEQLDPILDEALAALELLH